MDGGAGIIAVMADLPMCLCLQLHSSVLQQNYFLCWLSEYQDTKARLFLSCEEFIKLVVNLYLWVTYVRDGKEMGIDVWQ